MTKPSTPSAEENKTGIKELIEARRLKKNEMIQAGIRIYGERFDTSHSLQSIHTEIGPKIVKPDEEGKTLSDESVKVAGRILTRRDMGKLCFAHIHDRSGKIQLKLNQKEIGTELYRKFMKEIDLGDIIGIKGPICRTKKGELSIQVNEFVILSKSLRPWPEKFHGVTDIEVRSRQRELDLGTNPESRDRFLIRSKIIQSLRNTLDQLGFFEVETPLMQAVPGGAAAKPFITHHEALDLDLYMRIAPELFLKRLLVGGFERVYEIGRAFRNEGIDTRHNPEFTILEAYQAYGDVTSMMDLTEALIQNAAKHVNISEPSYRGIPFNVNNEFERASLVDLFKNHLNLNLIQLCETRKWEDAAKSKGLQVPKNSTDRKCFDLMFDEKILPHLKNPTFVLDYPTEFSPLAKQKPNQPCLTDRFELFLAQEEVANAYTEQNDPDEQSSRFKEELSKRQHGDEEAMPVDEEFINALEYGMPPAGGLGIGIDRLTMVLTGTESIREVILFPLLKPQN